MSEYIFGTGQLFATPVGGGAPLRMGALQDVSVDFSGDLKMLYGQYQMPLDVARGKTKVEWKAGTANIDVNAFNQTFFGSTVSPGGELIQVVNEAASVPTTPFQVTVANAATFYMDLGVYRASDGTPLTQIASGTPTTGQYKVSAVGVYTFAAADTGIAMLFNYLYASVATTGSGGTMTLSNQLMGAAPQFQLVLSQLYKAKSFTLILFACTAEKLSMPLKQDDYLVPEISGQAFANSAGQICRMTTTSVTGGGA
jgi:hypothetical protein